MLDNKKVERFIAACMKYEGDLYSQPKRMVPGFSDCSSIPYKALKAIGLLDESQTTRTISTKFMRDGDSRMYQIPMGDLQRGDLLWWQKPGTTDKNYYGHTGVYLGNGKVLEAIKPRAKITSIKRLDWQRVYRIKALEVNSAQSTVQVKEETKPQYALLYVAGKQTKVSPYIKNGVSYIKLKNIEVPIREFFEELGMTVKWSSGRIDVV